MSSPAHGPVAGAVAREAESRTISLFKRSGARYSDDFDTSNPALAGLYSPAHPEDEAANPAFTASDIRFTTKGNALYAVCMAWPGEQALIKSLGSGSSVGADRIEEVTLLGSQGPLAWSQDDAGLTIETPAEQPCEHAFAFKIALKDAP